MVYIVNDSRQIVASRSRDNNLLGTSSQVSRSLLLRSIETCALQNNVYVQLAPRQLSSVRNSVDSDLLTINNDEVLTSLYSVLVLTELATERTERSATRSTPWSQTCPASIP